MVDEQNIYLDLEKTYLDGGRDIVLVRNNSIKNLEWCTQLENERHSIEVL